MKVKFSQLMFMNSYEHIDCIMDLWSTSLTGPNFFAMTQGDRLGIATAHISAHWLCSLAKLVYDHSVLHTSVSLLYE